MSFSKTLTCFSLIPKPLYWPNVTSGGRANLTVASNSVSEIFETSNWGCV